MIQSPSNEEMKAAIKKHREEESLNDEYLNELEAYCYKYKESTDINCYIHPSYVYLLIQEIKLLTNISIYCQIENVKLKEKFYENKN